MLESVRYRPDVEVSEAGERELFEKIVQALSHGKDMAAAAAGGHYVRPSHAKAHGHLKGEMRVLEDFRPRFDRGFLSRRGRFRCWPVWLTCQVKCWTTEPSLHLGDLL